MEIYPASGMELAPDSTLDSDCSDALFIVDEHGYCVWANDAGAVLLRVTPAELWRSAFWELVTERLDRATCASWRRGVAKRAPADLGEYRSPAGRCFVCRSLPSSAGALLCLVDITTKESALQAAREERRRMESFLAVLAHELRNPLSTLVNGVALLQVGTADIDRIRLLDVLQRQLRHFVNVVDDLFDVSALALGRVRMRMAEVDVDALVAHAASSVADLVKNKKQRVDVGPTCGALVHGDFTRLSQALINLLKNAISYTAPGGALSINARMVGDEVEISVADTGRGIALERLPHVFDRVYEQWGRNAQNPTGLGIGLGVVRRIAELHGGSVVAHSNGLGSGSEFTVRLPSLAKAISSRKGGLAREERAANPKSEFWEDL